MQDDEDDEGVDDIVDIEFRRGSVMNHPAELALHQYMENAANGKSTMSPDTIKQVGLMYQTALATSVWWGQQA